MTVDLDQETSDIVTGITTYLNDLDGGTREAADVIKWAVGAAMSCRPDIIHAIAAIAESEGVN
jgi:hypothetical protein